MVLTERESTERTALIGVATCGAGLLLIIVSVIFSNSLVQVADLFNSFLQFVSIGLSWLTLRALRKDNRWTLYLDPLASGITVGFMIQSAWKLTRHSIHDLLDRSLEEPLQVLINRQLVLAFDEYTSLDGVRSRYSGQNVFIEIFLGFEPQRSLAEIQNITDTIKRNLEAEIPHAEVLIIPRAHSTTPDN